MVLTIPDSIRLIMKPIPVFLAIFAFPICVDGLQAAEPEVVPPGFSVRIASPGAWEVAYGPTSIQAEVIPPSGSTVVQVEFHADGLLLARDREPPYEILWQAGTDMASHIIRVIALFSDQSRGEDLITTRGHAFMHHEIVEGEPIEHVQLAVSVIDRAGLPVEGLKAADFAVRDGKETVSINGFGRLVDRAEEPLSIAIMVDRSGSMGQSMKEWRRATLQLLGGSRRIDQIRVSAFGGNHVVLQDFTRDYLSLARSLIRFGHAEGGTRLFRALNETIRDMRDLPGRKAVILMTDGLDTDVGSPSGAITANMFRLSRETMRSAVRSRVTVFLILPRPTSRGYLPIQDLAVQTGGRFMYASENLGALMRGLGDEVLGSYLLEYDTGRPENPDKKRRLEVNVRGADEKKWKVRHSLGVYGHVNRFDQLTDDVNAGNARQRARALIELTRLKMEDVDELLIDGLDDHAPIVRRTALEMLGEIRASRHLKSIIARAHDTDTDVRQAAIDAAVACGKEALPYLLKIAKSRRSARTASLRALGEIGDPQVLGVLLEASRHGSCPVRAAALEGIGELLAAADGLQAKGETGPPWQSASIARLVEGNHDSCDAVVTISEAALSQIGATGINGGRNSIAPD
jgi:VWFA-related protein